MPGSVSQGAGAPAEPGPGPPAPPCVPPADPIEDRSFGEALLAVIAWCVGFLSGLCLALAWAGLAGWVVGEVVSDRFYLTQFLEWVPTLFVLCGTGALFLLALVLHRFRALLVDA